MARAADRREEITERLVAHLLAHGLERASLRQLAEAAGASDRMLLYYFPDKAALMTALLARVAEGMRREMDALAPPHARLAPSAMSALLWRAVRAEALRPYMRLWLEMAGRSARGEEPFRAVGAAIALGFQAWVAERINTAGANARGAVAAQMLARLEGLVLLSAFGDEALVALAAGEDG